MTLVGLTGGIATGKSTVAAMLRDLGHVVIDADQVARDLVQPGAPLLQELVEAFGDSVLMPDGKLDRGELRARIASDAAARARLNSLMHPAIRSEIQRRVALHSDAPLVFVEAALLVETGGYREYDALVVVTCESDVQFQRLMSRDGGDDSTARGMVSAQMPLPDKEALADHVIRNDGDLPALADAVGRLLKELPT